MRLIDADAFEVVAVQGKSDDFVEGAQYVLEMIDNAPTIEARPVAHGQWVSFLDGDSIMPERYYKCSRCGRVERRKEPYCHCGASMDAK